MVAVAATWWTGCSTSKQHQLEAVARDWSNVMRASQIIPVYPLTEDLYPGDVFLVQVPIDRQQEIYKAKGYLPLDNHILRLHPERLHEFYDHSFLAKITNAWLPSDWIRPGHSNSASWQPAPHAAFPTYSFSVKRGAGLNLAVPVQGVPVGLSLLGTDSASGTIVIRKAATLGVDTFSLFQQARSWAATNAEFLAPFAPSANDKRRNYLRVVTRVYAAGEMDVALADSSSRAAGADVGVPKPVDLLFADLPSGVSNTGPATLTNFTNNVGILNRLLEGAQGSAAGQMLPGGSLRVSAASSRFVSLRETFPYPLVIGYLGFDCTILPGGVLGPPIPTHSRLEAQLEDRSVVTEFAGDRASLILSTWLESDAIRRTEKEDHIRDWLQSNNRALRMTSFVYDARHVELRNQFLEEKSGEFGINLEP
jgi:hypothetical protein